MKKLSSKESLMMEERPENSMWKSSVKNTSDILKMGFIKVKVD
jgi:hypothetical protein